MAKEKKASADVVKQYDININVGDGGGGSNSPTAPPQPGEGIRYFDPVSVSQQVFAQLPYGGEISKGIGTMKSIGKTVDSLVSGSASALSIALLALSTAKMAHDMTSSYVKDLRQSGEMQRRAGIYRRDAK